MSVTASELKSRLRSEVGFDFSSIRIFPVSPHEAAAQPDVLALTLGGRIHLAPAISDLPAESQRAVMAHEFAHVAQQQNQSGRAAGEASLSRGDWASSSPVPAKSENQAALVHDEPLVADV